MANSFWGWGGSGEQTVATAGTAVEILSSGDIHWHSLTIVAKTGNTGQVYVGGSDVASTTNDGLDADEIISFQAHLAHDLDLSKIFIDVDTNGEGVDFYVAR